jgi:ribosomal protein S18 acetylase RimI-like enzyme
MDEVVFREILASDRAAVREYITTHWKSDRMVSRGRLYYPGDHNGFVALQTNQLSGLITYEHVNGDYEITILHTNLPRRGIGRKLVELVVHRAKEARAGRLWLITTNDNIQAIGFYQKIGFDLVKLHYNALENSRLIKPEIPLLGSNNIPLKHELEFELKL